MWKIKGLDNRPVRIEPSLEDIQLPEKRKLDEYNKLKEREREILRERGVAETSSEVIQHIENIIQSYQHILDIKEDFYKNSVKNSISNQNAELQRRISRIHKKYKENPWVIWFILGVFFEDVLKMIQEVEGMKWTPKNFEVCSNIGYEILHVPVWNEVIETNNKIRRILLDGSRLLAHHIHNRKLTWGEDDRLSAKFIHNPENKKPMYLDTEFFSVIYSNELDVESVVLRQVLKLAKPKMQTPYNLELFQHMCSELKITFSCIVKIIQQYK